MVFLPVLTVLILMCAAFATTEKADAAAKYERLDTRGTPYNTGQRLEAAGGCYLKDWGELYFSKTKEGSQNLSENIQSAAISDSDQWIKGLLLHGY